MSETKSPSHTGLISRILSATYTLLETTQRAGTWNKAKIYTEIFSVTLGADAGFRSAKMQKCSAKMYST